MIRFFSLLLTLFFATTSFAAPNGVLRVIDADTFDVGGVRVRLFGVDAPEMGQPCSASGRTWDCGRWARDLVRDRFEGRHANCTQRDIDRYGRVVATCEIAGVDMGESLVTDGIAWAYRRYSSLYDLDEKAAAVAGRGLWGFTVQMPSDYRARQVTGQGAPDGGCLIKGNISNSGRIYHVPGGRDYDRTAINPSRGERWFCSRAEAEAAGWRAARN
ncbi:thermonuclease family protein [Yoonia sp.]|uniref:thermonuclease family protein n=1 Tax=Yoonia sp. TaxID=2212373 RepID=UPI0019D8A7E3|nr:thermonuclease family protein [Yoonia sp.]MBE0412526.1 thermonuclease family protein [Yoonia sp.]